MVSKTASKGRVKFKWILQCLENGCLALPLQLYRPRCFCVLHKRNDGKCCSRSIDPFTIWLLYSIYLYLYLPVLVVQVRHWRHVWRRLSWWLLAARSSSPRHDRTMNRLPAGSAMTANSELILSGLSYFLCPCHGGGAFSDTAIPPSVCLSQS